MIGLTEMQMFILILSTLLIPGFIVALYWLYSASKHDDKMSKLFHQRDMSILQLRKLELKKKHEVTR